MVCETCPFLSAAGAAPAAARARLAGSSAAETRRKCGAGLGAGGEGGPRRSVVPLSASEEGTEQSHHGRSWAVEPL